jgi:hypothetical protein
VHSYAELNIIIHCGWFRWTHPTNHLTHLRGDQIAEYGARRLSGPESPIALISAGSGGLWKPRSCPSGRHGRWARAGLSTP